MFSMASLISGVGIAFYRGADFAAVCLAFVPVIFIILCVFMAQIKKAAIAKMGVIKKLGGVVEESLTAIRLIASFANEEREERRFNELSEQVCQVAKKQ
jgi:ABC-type multidrug transport system fused ATPase/permease subunit